MGATTNFGEALRQSDYRRRADDARLYLGLIHGVCHTPAVVFRYEHGGASAASKRLPGSGFAPVSARCPLCLDVYDICDQSHVLLRCLALHELRREHEATFASKVAACAESHGIRRCRRGADGSAVRLLEIVPLCVLTGDQWLFECASSGRNVSALFHNVRSIAWSYVREAWRRFIHGWAAFDRRLQRDR